MARKERILKGQVLLSPPEMKHSCVAGSLNAEALGSRLLHQLVPATLDIGESDFSALVRCEHAEVVDLAGGGIVRAVIDMEFGIGERITGDAVSL